MKRVFVQSSNFSKMISDIAKKELEIELEVERSILAELERPYSERDVIEGTGGFSKIRVKKEGKGKSGSYRVIYLDVPKNGIVYLVLIYDKTIKDNINQETKNVLLKMSKELKK
ncbi:MAG: type II toxin-antitoxin system RelE/ParE family toxin [Oligoflexia bacterium]|nr:type II toxin-antitoxin system RelE/ParE family toxin [Oligoflexia bacterium]